MENKTIYIITGGIASGKSTLSYNFINYFNIAELPFVSTDVYYNVFFKNNDKFEEYYNKTRQFTDERLDLYLSKGESFVWETVLSKEKKRNFLEKCKKEGYKLICFFVGVDNIEEVIRRSVNREKEGNHYVPREFIIDRYEKSLESLKWLPSVVDTLAVFDNTEMLKLLIYKSEEENYFSENLPKWLESVV